jgi:hypothetical protein
MEVIKPYFVENFNEPEPGVGGTAACIDAYRVGIVKRITN